MVRMRNGGAADMAVTVDAFNRLSLSEQVEKALREEIISGRLKPNQRIDVAHYSEVWATSPTPVRDAIKSLEAAGFVTVSPRRGVNVVALDQDALRETYQVRIALECTAIRLACSQVPMAKATEALELYRRASELDGDKQAALLGEIDLLVHDLALEYCNNSRLRRMMVDMNDLIRWSRLSVIRHLPQAFETTLPEHLRLCEALVARDGETGAREMFTHLNNSLTRICAYLDANPEATDATA